jgi:methionine aminopeptidase
MREALDKAIAICGPGVEFKKIGATIKCGSQLSNQK